MKNNFEYSLDNKRYHTWNYHLMQKFGEKVFKVSLNAGFTCPNIDGTKGYGGCIYCSDAGSGDFAGIAFDTAITPLSSSELEMISFMTIVFNINYPPGCRSRTIRHSSQQM